MCQSGSTSRVRLNPSEKRVQSQTHLAERLGDLNQFRIFLGTSARSVCFTWSIGARAVPVRKLGMI
jgi:hypothetical protein